MHAATISLGGAEKVAGQALALLAIVVVCVLVWNALKSKLGAIASTVIAIGLAALGATIVANYEVWGAAFSRLVLA